MSYMVLMKNRNGAVMTTETRLLQVDPAAGAGALPHFKTENGKKLVSSY